MYRQADHDLAKKAETTFQEAKITKIFEEERKQLARTLEREVAVVRRNTLARRDQILLKIIEAGDKERSWRYWLSDMNKRLTNLAGIKHFDFSDKTKAPKLDTQYSKSLDLKKKIGKLQDESELLGFGEVNYNIVKSQGDPKLFCSIKTSSIKLPTLAGRDASVQENLDEYKNRCSSYLKTLGELKTLYAYSRFQKSLLVQVSKKIETIREGQNNIKEQIAAVKKELKAAEKEFKDKSKTGTSEEVAKAAKKVKDYLEKLGKIKLIPEYQQKLKALIGDNAISDLEVQGAISKMEIQKSNLLQLAKTVSGAGDEVEPEKPEDKKFSLTVVSSLVSLGKVLEKNRNNPALMPLVLEKQRLSLEEERLKKEGARLSRSLKLLIRKQKSMLLEIEQVNLAALLSKNFLVDNNKRKCPIYWGALMDDFKSSNSECKKMIGPKFTGIYQWLDLRAGHAR